MKPEVTKRAIFDMQVCIPIDWTNEQIKKFADSENPCGTEHGWVITKNGDPILLNDPEKNPCESRVGFVHVMLHA